MRRNLNWLIRILFFVAAILFLAPAAWSDIVACAMGFALVAYCVITGKKMEAAEKLAQ